MDLCFHVDICQKSISDLNRFLKVWKGWRELSTRRLWISNIVCSSQCRCQSWDTPPRIRGSGRRARRRSTRPPAAGCRWWWGSWWRGGGRSTAARHTPAIFISCSQAAVRLQCCCMISAFTAVTQKCSWKLTAISRDKRHAFTDTQDFVFCRYARSDIMNNWMKETSFSRLLERNVDLQSSYRLLTLQSPSKGENSYLNISVMLRLLPHKLCL